MKLQYPKVTMSVGSEDVNQFFWNIQLSTDSAGLLEYLYDTSLQFQRKPVHSDFTVVQGRVVLKETSPAGRYLYSVKELKVGVKLAWRFKEGYMLENDNPESDSFPPSKNTISIVTGSGIVSVEQMYQDQVQKYDDSMMILGMIKASVEPGHRELLAGETSPLMAICKLDDALNSRATKVAKVRGILETWSNIPNKSMTLSHYFEQVSLFNKQIRALDYFAYTSGMVLAAWSYLPQEFQTLRNDLALSRRVKEVENLREMKKMILEHLVKSDTALPYPFENPLQGVFESLSWSD